MKYLYLSILLIIPFCIQAQYKTALNVATDGSGDYSSIQAAIDNTKSFPDKRITIHIKNGIYEEKIKVYSWNNKVTLKGESKTKTIIRWSDSFKKINKGRNSTFHTATLLVQGDEFRAENLTIENDAGEVGQAISVSVEADRSVFLNCRMLGNQDTLYAAGLNTRQYYQNCFIEGTTDFIFGSATAFFENCIIHSKKDSYITAASTPKGRDFGFVFKNCELTASTDVTEVYLGRPWRNYAKTIFVNCKMGKHIRPEGWHNWSSKEKEQTVFYAEYGNKGTGANNSKRAIWSHQLSKRKAKKYTSKHVLKGFVLPDM